MAAASSATHSSRARNRLDGCVSILCSSRSRDVSAFDELPAVWSCARALLSRGEDSSSPLGEDPCPCVRCGPARCPPACCPPACCDPAGPELATTGSVDENTDRNDDRDVDL